MIGIKELLEAIFAEKYYISEENSVIFGEGVIETQRFTLLGVKESTSLGVNEAFIMAEKVLNLLKEQSILPVLLLVDVVGQQLAMRDEWLGMNEYFAHLLTCLQALRQQGNRLISLVYNQAVGGGFIAYGLMADTILALPHAQLAVMWLEGIAKVTRIDLEALQQLSKTLPVFAPGADNFYQLGGLHDIVELSALPARLLQEAALTGHDDQRAEHGYVRGGRKLTYPIINEVGQINAS